MNYLVNKESECPNRSNVKSSFRCCIRFGRRSFRPLFIAGADADDLNGYYCNCALDICYVTFLACEIARVRCNVPIASCLYPKERERREGERGGEGRGRRERERDTRKVCPFWSRSPLQNSPIAAECARYA